MKKTKLAAHRQIDGTIPGGIHLPVEMAAVHSYQDREYVSPPSDIGLGGRAPGIHEEFSISPTNTCPRT